MLCLPYARSLELVMNDGGRGWDKAQGDRQGLTRVSQLFEGSRRQELQGHDARRGTRERSDLPSPSPSPPKPRSAEASSS